MQHWIDSHSAAEPEYCGDLAAHVKLAGTAQHAVIVGDVAGRGAKAGEAANALLEHVRLLVCTSDNLASLLHSASDFFGRSLAKESTPFASMFVAVIDNREGVMRYASAGHEPALLFSANGTHKHLDPTGPVLGVATLPAFRERKLLVFPSDILVVVTDGVTEARRHDGERLDFFGSNGVVRAALAAGRAGRNPARAICHAAIAHAEGRVTDDATAFVSLLRPTEPALRLLEFLGRNGIDKLPEKPVGRARIPRPIKVKRSTDDHC